MQGANAETMGIIENANPARRAGFNIFISLEEPNTQSPKSEYFVLSAQLALKIRLCIPARNPRKNHRNLLTLGCQAVFTLKSKLRVCLQTYRTYVKGKRQSIAKILLQKPCGFDSSKLKEKTYEEVIYKRKRYRRASR